MNAFKEWWNNNTPRDQMAMMALAIAVGLYLLYAIVSASHSKYMAQVSTNQRLKTSLSQVRELSAQLQARNAATETGGAGSLVDAVNKSMSLHSLKLSNIQPQSNGAVRLRLEQVPYSNVIAWLHEMEVVQGLKIKDGTITTSSEKGLVSLNVTLRH